MFRDCVRYSNTAGWFAGQIPSIIDLYCTGKISRATIKQCLKISEWRLSKLLKAHYKGELDAELKLMGTAP